MFGAQITQILVKIHSTHPIIKYNLFNSRSRLPPKRHESFQSRLSASWDAAEAANQGSAFAKRFHSTERRRYGHPPLPSNPDSKFDLVKNRFDRSETGLDQLETRFDRSENPSHYLSDQSIFNRLEQNTAPDLAVRSSTLKSRRNKTENRFVQMLDDPHASFNPEKSRGGEERIGKYLQSVSVDSGGSRNQSVQTGDLDSDDMMILMIPEPETLRNRGPVSGNLHDQYDNRSFAVLGRSPGAGKSSQKSVTDKSIAEYFEKSESLIGSRKAIKGKREVLDQGFDSPSSTRNQFGNKHPAHISSEHTGKSGSVRKMSDLQAEPKVFHLSPENGWTYSGQCDVEILSDPITGVNRIGETGINRMGLFPTLPNRSRPKLNTVEKPVRKCESFNMLNKPSDEEVSKEKCNNEEKSCHFPEFVMLDENKNYSVIQQQKVQCATSEVLSGAKPVKTGSIHRQKEMWLKRSKSRARMLKTEEQVKIVKFRRFLMAANSDSLEFKRRIMKAKNLDQRKDEKER